jgi:IS30 family transposase
MGQCYGQLSLEERVEIYRLHAGGRSQNEIASALDRAPSTISRELRRNSRPTKVWTGGYKPVRAQQLAERRRRWDGRFKLARQPDLRDCVGKSLAMGHSPEQIAGRLALEHGRVIISHESIYRFIYHRAAQKDYWHRLLPRHKRRRGRRRRPDGSPAGFIKQRRSITERPAEVEGRGTPGHWEADFMLFARCGQGLLVLHERKTRFSLVQHPVDLYPWRKMHRSRAPSIAPGTFFVAQSWADCITNMPGFNLRQALRSKAVVVSVAETPGRESGRHGRERRAQANRCRSVESGFGDVRTGG